jgi:hypothetical protein
VNSICSFVQVENFELCLKMYSNANNSIVGLKKEKPSNNDVRFHIREEDMYHE